MRGPRVDASYHSLTGFAFFKSITNTHKIVPKSSFGSCHVLFFFLILLSFYQCTKYGTKEKEGDQIMCTFYTHFVSYKVSLLLFRNSRAIFGRPILLILQSCKDTRNFRLYSDNVLHLYSVYHFYGAKLNEYEIEEV